jgi:hypothetical protein
VANKAAFRWDIGTKEITFMAYDLSSLRRKIPFSSFRVSSQQEAFDAISKFCLELNQISEGGEVEYHILNSTAPWQTMRNPHPLSLYIKDSFEAAVGAVPRWSKKTQLRRLLKKPELTKFRDGLKKLQIIGARSKASEWHLWAVFFHATKANHKKHLTKLWESIRSISARTKVGKQQFSEWYAQL